MTHQPLLRARHSRRTVADDVVELFPEGFRRFVDTRFTDGSAFLAQPRSPKLCLLTTDCPDTANFLRALQTSPDALAAHARLLWEDTSRAEFESVHASDLPPDPAEAAARFLYLNQLTAPGTSTYAPRRQSRQFPEERLTAWATHLQGVRVLEGSAWEMFDDARPTDLLYLEASQEELEAALTVAADSPGRPVVVAPGPPADPCPAGLVLHELQRTRPGARHPDTVYLRTTGPSLAH